ncbi:MAG: hypothetical protein LLG42_15085 [Chloroflexi bacterium]|nr:hypothetical protein [Chloroflexota bacterium]
MGKLGVRKPKLRVTKNGVKVTSPTARIGGKAGINISKSGVSGSVRTPLGTISTGRASKRGHSTKKNSGCFGMLLLVVILIAILLIIL